MSSNKHSRVRFILKLLVVVVGLIVAWQLLLSDAVSNALLSFLLGGEVPGTSTVVAPDIMILGVMIFAGVCVLAFILRSWLLHLRTKNAAVALAEEAVASELVAAEEVAPEVSKVSKAAKVPKAANVRKNTAPVPRLHERFAAFRLWVRPKSRVLRGVVLRLGYSVIVHAIGLYELVYVVTRTLATKANRVVIVLWGAAKPVLLRASDWMDEQIGRFQVWYIQRLQQFESVKLLREIRLEIKRTVRDIKRTKTWKSTKAYVRKIKKRLKLR